MVIRRILPALYADGGAALVRLVGAARSVGATVSIDMAEIDPTSEARAVDWESLLARTLPGVDVMKASVDDLDAMLPHGIGIEPIAWPDALVELGAAAAARISGRPIGEAYELVATIELPKEPRSGWSIGPDRAYHGPRDKEV